MAAWRHGDPRGSVGQRGDAKGVMLCQPVEKRGALVFSPGMAAAAGDFSFPSPPAAVTVLSVPRRTWSHPYTLLLKKVLEGALERC